MEIKDHPDYLIYDDGRIYSKRYNRHNDTYTNEFLKFGINGEGYHNVKLYTDEGYSSLTVHRLVALHYVENPDNKECVDHIDGNKINNHYSNLRWASRMENSNNYQKKRVNNKSGIANIRFEEDRTSWTYSKSTHGKRYQKRFETRDQAIAHKLIHEIFIKFE